MLRELPRLTSQRADIDISPDKFGFLETSTHLLTDVAMMRQRMASDGYLFFPGLLNQDEVLSLRGARLRPSWRPSNYSIPTTTSWSALRRQVLQ